MALGVVLRIDGGGISARSVGCCVFGMVAGGDGDEDDERVIEGVVWFYRMAR
jgi:hypothetical protein